MRTFASTYWSSATLSVSTLVVRSATDTRKWSPTLQLIYLWQLIMISEYGLIILLALTVLGKLTKGYCVHQDKAVFCGNLPRITVFGKNKRHVLGKQMGSNKLSFCSHIWTVETNMLVLLDKIEVVNQQETLLLFKKLAKRICACSEEKYKVKKTASLPPTGPRRRPPGGNAQVQREHKLLTPAFRTNPALLMHMDICIL